MNKTTSLWIVALCLFGCGPLLVFPGGELEGAVSATPDNWGFTEQIGTVQLETRPGDPYSVNIWATTVGDSLYLHAGANRANWVENIEADPLIRIRIDSQIYPLRAVRVQDPVEFQRFADAYEAKYGTRPRNENVAEVYVFRLEAR